MKKRNKDWPYEYADRRGNETVGDDHNRYGLRRGKEDGDDNVDRGAKNVAPTRRIHARFEVGNLGDDGLELGLIDLAGQELRFVGDEIVEARPDCREWVCCNS